MWPPHRIFGIALNKTGATSLHQAVQLLGFRSVHHGPGVDDRIQRAVDAGERVLRYCPPDVRSAHAFFDLRAIERHFEEVERQFPHGRFLLSPRDLDAWLRSRERHVGRNVRCKARAVFDDIAADPGEPAVAEARRRAAVFETKWAPTYPNAVACLTGDLATVTVHLRFPRQHWRRICHTNLIERTCGETRRR